MSFLKGLKKIEPKPIKTEIKPIVKQIVKQKLSIVKQKTFEINPEVKSIDDIPNTNIMTSGKLIGIHLRAGKKEMLKNLMNYIGDLIKNESNNKK